MCRAPVSCRERKLIRVAVLWLAVYVGLITWRWRRVSDEASAGPGRLARRFRVRDFLGQVIWRSERETGGPSVAMVLLTGLAVGGMAVGLTVGNAAGGRFDLRAADRLSGVAGCPSAGEVAPGPGERCVRWPVKLIPKMSFGKDGSCGQALFMQVKLSTRAKEYVALWSWTDAAANPPPSAPWVFK